MQNKILIVDDEADIVESLVYFLEKEGFITEIASTGSDAMRLLEQQQPTSFDAILLDLMLPDISGTEICKTIRNHPRLRHIPILMLTARSEEIDRVVGFEVGADDYVVKPFSLREIMLRLRAIVRRSKGERQEQQPIHFGNLSIDPIAHRVKVEADDIRLTALEFRLLMTFLERKGRVQTRDMLLADVWGIRADVTTRTVDTHVKRLREKLGMAGNYIETLRGVGYRFSEVPVACNMLE